MLTTDQRDDAAYILHVARPDVSVPLESVARRLQQAGWSVRSCPDVHRALALLSARGGESPCGVLVRVDGLDAREFEFFQCVRRLHPALPVYAYSNLGQRNKLDMAVRFGASAAVDETSVATVRFDSAVRDAGEPVGRRPETPAPSAQLVTELSPEAPVDHDPGMHPVEVSAADDERSPSFGIAPTDAARADTADDAAPLDGNESAPRARVPWVASQDRPQRKPPNRRKDATPRSTPPRDEDHDLSHGDAAQPSRIASADQATADHAPLLTPEELAALMGPDAPERVHDAPREVRRP